MKKLFPIAALLLVAGAAFSQNTAIGIMLGASNYQGDLSERQITVIETHMAGGIFVRRQILPKFTVKGNFYAGKISGDDLNYAERIHRGYHFESTVLEGGINLEWDMLGKARNFRKGFYNKFITPYLLIGFGAVYFDPATTGLPQNAEENKANKRAFNFIIPLGAGVKADLSSRMTAGVEFVSHLPFTDYLDGVSESGEPGNNDWYVFLGLTMQYWINAPKMATTGDNIW